MSVDAVSGTSGSTALRTRDPRLDEIVAKAKIINARPGKPEEDRYFVYEVLGRSLVDAKATQKRYAKLFHEDKVRQMGGSAEDISVCSNAFVRVMVCMKAASTEGAVTMPGAIDLASPGANVASVIIAAAGYAERSIKTAQATWQRKVDDGTVDAVKAHAKDLFESARSFAAHAWTEAIRRPSPKKD